MSVEHYRSVSMPNGKQQVIRLTCCAGFVVTAVLASVLPIVLIRSSSRSDIFWFKILWAVFLAGVAWFSLYSFFAVPLSPDEPSKGGGRVSPILAIGGFCYAAFSIAVMIIISFLPKAEWLDRLHMAIQIVLGAAAILLALFLRLNLVFGERKEDTAKQNPAESQQTK